MTKGVRRLLAAAEREHQRRLRARAVELVVAFTLEAIARGTNGVLHAPQLRYMQDLARYILLMCSRRAGKTVGIAGRYAKRSVDKPSGNRVYIALTKDQARGIMWEPIWKPMCERWGLCGSDAHNETRMVTTFPNGSTVRFTGSDDIRHIGTELGGALDEATIDEAQNQPEAVLRQLTGKILPPALGDRMGTLTIAGVIPDVAAGYFWKTWKTGRWSNHRWSMFDNPHFPDPMGVVREFLDKHPLLTIDSPLIQRDYFGRDVHDATATAYQYDPARNGYDPVAPGWLREAYLSQAWNGHALPFCHPMQASPDEGPLCGLMAAEPDPDIDTFGFAIDPAATSDRVAIEGNGWGSRTKRVQHVACFCTPRGARLTTGQMFAVAGLLNAMYSKRGYVKWRYDAGSSQNTIDNLQRDFGIALILAAKKADMRGQVDRSNDLLTSGKRQVMRGSALEEDMLRTRWDEEARARGQWKWNRNHHPDPADADRYSLQDYFDAFEEPDKRTPEEKRLAAYQADDDPDLFSDDAQQAGALESALGWRR